MSLKSETITYWYCVQLQTRRGERFRKKKRSIVQYCWQLVHNLIKYRYVSNISLFGFVFLKTCRYRAERFKQSHRNWFLGILTWRICILSCLSSSSWSLYFSFIFFSFPFLPLPSASYKRQSVKCYFIIKKVVSSIVCGPDQHSICLLNTDTGW